MSEGLFSPIKKIEMEDYSDLMKKVCLLGIGRILRQVLRELQGH